VQRLLVRHQPAVLGGPKKVLKTTTLMDLAVSLASATPFLGYFKVHRPHRVLMMSGESGEAVLQETGNRVCAARGVNPMTLDVFWSFKLPQVANAVDRVRLQEGLKSLGIGVVILDPLYLCLLAGKGAKHVEAGNLYHVGPLLASLCSACLDVGATPILCHHARKNLANGHEPMELEDLAFAGIQEFSRQWILENRREPYEPGSGQHRLWLSAGGSVGHGGLWAVDIDEGALGDDFRGRKWDVTVSPAAELKQGKTQQKADEKERRRLQQVQDDGTKVLMALDKLANDEKAAVYSRVRAAAHLSNDRMVRAVLDLEEGGIVEKSPVQIATGKNLKVKKVVEGLRRKRTTDGTDGTNGVLPARPASD
jgi:hypothetical protein